MTRKKQQQKQTKPKVAYGLAFKGVTVPQPKVAYGLAFKGVRGPNVSVTNKKKRKR